MAVTMVGVGGGVELCAETFGDPEDPAVLLLGGATSSMDWWEPAFCQALADAGRLVVRYDHRDTGRSTTWPVGQPGYTGDDLSLDPLRLLDGLFDGMGIAAAHLVGVSMGGGISQDLAVRFPDRVLSLTLVATTCAFERRDQRPLPPMEPRVREQMEEDAGALDWSDPDAVVEEQVRVQRVYAGGLGIDEDRVRAIARQVLERSVDPHAGVVNHWMVVGGGDDAPARTMADIRAPTLVVHGTDDPMFPLPHGEALAREIPGARLLVVEGMGHEPPPPPTWDQVLPAIVEHTG
jgi:pimeloyl-ACP methyl ester carboxylesterase